MKTKLRNAKQAARLRRARKSRSHIRRLETNRLTVFRSSQHTYAQIMSPDGSQVLAQASTVEKDLKQAANGNCDAAARVGAAIAERAKAAGITEVAFDRSGYKFHGRVKALAEAAREAGLQF